MKNYILVLGLSLAHMLHAASAKLRDPSDEHFVGACQQVLDEINVTLISQKSLIGYLHDKPEEFYVGLPASISKASLDEEINIWVAHMRRINAAWTTYATMLHNLKITGPNANEIAKIIGKYTWGSVASIRNIVETEESCKNLLAIYPEARRIRETDHFILSNAIRAFLPFMTPAYREDFASYTLEDGRQTIIQADGSKSFLPIKSGVCLHKGNLQILTSTGAKIHLPARNIREANCQSNLIIFKMHSGFIAYLPQLIPADIELIMRTLQPHTAQRAESHLASPLAAKKAGREAKSLLPKEVISADTSAADRAAEALLAELKLKALGAGNGKNKAAVSRSSLSTVAVAESLPSKDDRTGTKEFYAPATGSAPVVAVDASSASASTAAVAVTYVDAPTAASTSTARKSSVLESGTDETATAARDVIHTAPIFSSTGACAPPPHRRMIPVLPPQTDIMERPRTAQAGISHKMKDVLSVILGVPLEGTSVKNINTVVWKNVVFLLKGLGFNKMNGSSFNNQHNQSIHLHALHYDDYRLNHKLLVILLNQLEYYGFSRSVLLGYL